MTSLRVKQIERLYRQESGWYRGYMLRPFQGDGAFFISQKSNTHKGDKGTMDMKEKLQELAQAARKRIDESDSLDVLNDVRIAYLGKKAS